MRMTAAEWAKWSVVTLMAIGILAGRIVTNSARRAAGKNIDAAGAIGVVIGILLRVWMLVAVLIWWQP